MLGNNTILRPEKGDGSCLKVNSIFDTLQGEGLYVGAPAIFIRLAGCNLACTFCDTEFDEYQEISVEEIIKRVKAFSHTYKKLVVLTGGEPFRQPISLLCEKLVNEGFKIQIETNGLLYRNIPEEVEVICSPKNTGNGYQQIRKDLLGHVKAIKFLISASNNLYQDIGTIGQLNADIKVYVQPMDEFDEKLNAANAILAMQVARKHNAILSMQLHKILRIE
ncbi:MAG: 7-carboxy-7-deazaguanine synthase [Candidatus Midichloria mitochondrii]